MNPLAPTRRLLKHMLKDGAPVFGTWCATGSAFSAELMCADEVGYVCVDQQHGLCDYASMLEAIRAIEARGVPALTRVPTNDAAYIGKVLDAGAQGVIVPMVNDAAEAARAAAACRYPPHGSRSFGPTRAALSLGSSDPRELGESAVCFVMVETRQGVRNIEEIVRTPGIDGVYVGPSDLALDLGFSPVSECKAPEHAAALDRIIQACQSAGLVPGIQCTSGAAARAMAERGFRLVTFAKDVQLISAGTRRELRAAWGLDHA